MALSDSFSDLRLRVTPESWGGIVVMGVELLLICVYLMYLRYAGALLDLTRRYMIKNKDELVKQE
jgi:hypothetical protein